MPIAKSSKITAACIQSYPRIIEYLFVIYPVSSSEISVGWDCYGLRLPWAEITLQWFIYVFMPYSCGVARKRYVVFDKEDRFLPRLAPACGAISACNNLVLPSRQQSSSLCLPVATCWSCGIFWFQTGSFEPLCTALPDDEEIAMKNMLRRLDTIVKVTVTMVTLSLYRCVHVDIDLYPNMQIA